MRPLPGRHHGMNFGVPATLAATVSPSRLLYFFNKTDCPRFRCSTPKSAVLRSLSVIDLGSCAYQLLSGVFMKKNVLAVSIAAMIGGLGFAGLASAGNVVSNAGKELVACLTPRVCRK